MIALKILDLKDFTKKLFIGPTFDRFLLKEASIVTFNRFTIDGRVRPGFYSEEEREKIEEYSEWSAVKAFCFSLIKGSRLPESFAIILKLPGEQVGRFLSERGSVWRPEQVGGMFLNIRYEEQVLYCVTGFSMSEFTMDKTLEREWDEAVKGFLKKEGVGVE